MKHINNSCEVISFEDLKEFERYFNVAFPLCFKEFYMAHNGGYVVEKDFMIDDILFDIHCFFSVKYQTNNISTIISNYEESMRLRNYQKEYVPFALDQGGNNYLINIGKEKYGGIYMWYHDIDYYENKVQICDNFSIISNLFYN